jgi:hypothetical protein
MLTELQEFIRDGEGLTVEFKRCANELANSVFETASAFQTDTALIFCSESRMTAQ